MFSPIIRFTFGFMVLLLLCSSVQSTCDDTGGWAKPVFELFNMRLVLLKKALPLKEEQETENIKEFANTLKEFQDKAGNFMKAPLSNPELPNDCLSMIANLQWPSFLDRTSLVTSDILVSNENGRGQKIDERIRDNIKNHLNSADKTSVYSLPRKDICQGVNARKITKEISITDVCPNVDSCATEGKPYGQQFLGTDLTDACTPDEKCDLSKAMRMMLGLFWYEINEWIVDRICPESCEGGNCTFEETYNKVNHDANLLMAFVSITPSYFTSTWKTFLEDAVATKAYFNLDHSLAMVQENENVFKVMQTACSDLLFTESCPYSDIYKEYVMIKKIQRYTKDKRSLALVRDFRNLPNINFKARLEQEQSTYQHIELLGTIKALDENLEASVSGISQYFQGLANFDEGIADADVAFIQGELDKYNTSLIDTQSQLKEDVEEIMAKMIVVTAANLGEATAFLAIKLAENSNPLKLIFSGPDLAEVVEATGKVADAATDVAKASALYIALDGLAEDSLKISEAFLGNRDQITGLKEVVEKIRQNKTDDIGKDADKFLEAYAAYTPQTDRSKLEKNNALWSAFKDATCDILSGEVGIAGATAKGIVGGKLLCEKLEGTLAQFFTLREDIFDFQFQLVDAVAAVVRGNIAKRFGGNIKGKGDVLHASQLFIGSFKMHYKFQSTASMFCDILEYQHNGEPARMPCSTVDGLYSKENLDVLIDHSFTASTNVIERQVYIPTQASFEGDTGYIDLAALARGENVVFKPPMNKDWLLNHRWITSRKTTDMPFVSEFKLFLPHKEYKTGADRELTTTTITLKSIASSHVSMEPSKKNIAYLLPRRHATFETVYEEGYTSCSGEEIDNPYSLCDNLPKICDASNTIQGSLSLYPTILSTWSLSYETIQGAREMKWDAPKPATNLLIKAEVKLMVKQKRKQRNRISGLISRSEVTVSENGCCDGNNVRISPFNNKCEPCPEKSTSHLRGYYCELDEETETSGSGSANEEATEGDGNI